MAIITAIGFVALLSIITGVIEHFQRNAERRMDRAAVKLVRDGRHIHAAG